MEAPANSSPLAKYRYRRRLPHLQKANAALFVTFCTGGRMFLPERARDLVLAHCLREAGIVSKAGEGARPTCAARIHLHAVVVMPDPVHLLLRPLRHENGWPSPRVDILQCLKSTTAHRINRLLGIDLLPSFRTKVSMISAKGRGKGVCRRAGTRRRR